VIIIVGSLFLMDEFCAFKNGIGDLIWPSILILVGIAILLKVILPKKISTKAKDFKENCGFTEEVSSDDFINVSRVFSGANVYVKSQNFKGGKASFVFGGGEFDFRGAQLADGINILKIECVFGGVKIYLPEDWDVSLETSGVFGGFSDERRHLHLENIDRTKKLIIKAEAVFGGGEISN